MKKKGKNKNKKNGLILALFAAAFLMAVGYAVYSSDLVINGTGKILSDWDVQFTRAVTNASLTTSAKGAKEGITPAFSNDGPTKGITLTLGVALTYFDDTYTYDVDITNFSEMFGAECTKIEFDYSIDEEYDLLDPDETDVRLIDWKILDAGLVAREGVTPGTIIAKDTSGTGAGTTLPIKLQAFWNEAAANAKLVPDETAKTYADANTYAETVTITFTFEAAQ